ncbi:MAG: pertactin-like passenger domain-containing protein, partial [Helicobacter sp.]|nr:pertactin-like passenger domain-containing protein [Helicobacter sp.]
GHAHLANNSTYTLHYGAKHEGQINGRDTSKLIVNASEVAGNIDLANNANATFINSTYKYTITGVQNSNLTLNNSTWEMPKSTQIGNFIGSNSIVKLQTATANPATPATQSSTKSAATSATSATAPASPAKPSSAAASNPSAPSRSDLATTPSANTPNDTPKSQASPKVVNAFNNLDILGDLKGQGQFNYAINSIRGDHVDVRGVARGSWSLGVKHQGQEPEDKKHTISLFTLHNKAQINQEVNVYIKDKYVDMGAYRYELLRRMLSTKDAAALDYYLCQVGQCRVINNQSEMTSTYTNAALSDVAANVDLLDFLDKNLTDKIAKNIDFKNDIIYGFNHDRVESNEQIRSYTQNINLVSYARDMKLKDDWSIGGFGSYVNGSTTFDNAKGSQNGILGSMYLKYTLNPNIAFNIHGIYGQLKSKITSTRGDESSALIPRTTYGTGAGFNSNVKMLDLTWGLNSNIGYYNIQESIYNLSGVNFKIPQMNLAIASTEAYISQTYEFATPLGNLNLSPSIRVGAQISYYQTKLSANNYNFDIGGRQKVDAGFGLLAEIQRVKTQLSYTRSPNSQTLKANVNYSF